MTVAPAVGTAPSGIARRDVLQVSPVLPRDAWQQALALHERERLDHLVTSWIRAAGGPDEASGEGPGNDPGDDPRDGFRGRCADGAGTGSDHRSADGLHGGSAALWRIPPLDRIARRGRAPVPAGRLRRSALADLVERWIRLTGGGPVRAVDRRFEIVDRAAARLVRGPVRAVLGREDGCLAAFEAARDRGARRFYDLPTAHHHAVRSRLETEIGEFPRVCRVAADRREFAPERAARKDAEIALADHVVVPSGFVASTLVRAGIAPGRVRVLPFAGEPEWLDLEDRPREPVFLHVGQISLRKGVHRLLRAWKRLGAHRTHRLRLVGTQHLEPGFLRDYRGIYEHVERLPRPALAREYRQARALVVNAMAEGLSMVIPEAMSCATAVIATRESGAGDLAEDASEAMLFDFGDDEALLAALDSALSDPASLESMGRRARERIIRWQWADYRREFADWLLGALDRPE